MHESSINFVVLMAIGALSLIAVNFLHLGNGRGRRLAATSLIVGITAALTYTAFLFITDNVHVVVPGEVYRSGQMRSGEMVSSVQTYRIKSVLNLRGENPTQQWYRDEVEAAKSLGITHIDFRMSARSGLSTKEIDDLIAIMKRSPKPLLVHCQGGADRTGLAAALYVYAFSGDDELAERQLSIVYGHLGLPFIPGAAMDSTWEMFEAARASNNNKR